MSQNLGVTVIFDGCTIVPPIAPPVPAVEHQQRHYTTSFASSNDDARVPLATDFGLVFFSQRP